MVRAQVRLTQEQLTKLRKTAAESGKSIAELVRLGVDFYLESRQHDRQAIRERALRSVGKFHSGLKDVAERHDHYLAEAYHDW